MISLKDICVNYSYKKVLNGISVTFDEGKIYSLLGENGAGKSTLAHVICGDLKPTSGTLYIENNKVSFKSPKDAIQRGITCVQQRPLLAPSISILENLKLGLPKDQLKHLKDNKIIPALLENWLPECKLSTLVKNLTDTECFIVSLISALLKNPKLLILDEPPSIPLERLKTLTDKGITLIIITHNLKEAVEKSDKIILLQNGLILQESNSNEITEEEIKGKLYGISKEVEVPECIKIEKIKEENVKHIFGITGYIPKNKTFIASNPELSILELITAFNPKGKQKNLETRAQNILQKAEVDIKLNEKAKNLSGGMLQRLILEREIAENPEKLIMFNPTHGLDVEATERLYKKLENLCKNGTQVIFGDNI